MTSVLAVVFLSIASQAMALSIGTFNIEYFNVSGKNAYSPSHCSSLAKTITASQVVKQQKVLASDSAEIVWDRLRKRSKFSKKLNPREVLVTHAQIN